MRFTISGALVALVLSAPSASARQLAPKPILEATPDRFDAPGTPIVLSARTLDGAPFPPADFAFEWQVPGALLAPGSSWSDPSPVVLPGSPNPFEAELILTDLGSDLPGKGAIWIGRDLGQATLFGRPTAWHPLELWFEGNAMSMFDDDPNPFLDGRLEMTFTRPDLTTIRVPGFFDGDGRGGPEGSVWKVRFAPDAPGTWSFEVSFQFGPGLAVADPGATGQSFAPNGASGSFEVAPRDPLAPGFLKFGRLEYVGEHYRRFAEGPYWIKSGTDSPENLLGFAGFAEVEKGADGVGVIHRFEPHADDWTLDDPELPNAGSGGGDPAVSRNLIGALNYLESVGVNAIYLLPMNLGGDGWDTAPYVGYAKTAYDKTHFHLGRLHQWEAIFRHAQEKGIQIQFVLAETEVENEQWLDDGGFGVERKLLYRELVARFGHHLAIKWNLAEENDYPVAQLEEQAAWLAAIDPWQHGIAAHNKPTDLYSLNNALLGSPSFTHTSVQYEPHLAGTLVELWRDSSATAGQPWVVDMDENNPAQTGAQPDNADELRTQALYDIYFSGGQLEWYLGGMPLPIGGDLDLEDFRTREELWLQTAAARGLLDDLPVHRMQPRDGRVLFESSAFGGAEVFEETGRAYAIYLPSAESEATILDLSGQTGPFTKAWFDPRLGQWVGPQTTLEGGGWISIGSPPYAPDQDWVLVVRRPNLWSPGTSLPISGGSLPAELDGGMALAGQAFFALSNTSGVVPGYDPASGQLPLELDTFLGSMLAAPNLSPLQPAIGVFDGEGRASATLSLPPLGNASLVGTTFSFVWLAATIEATPDFPIAPLLPTAVSDVLEIEIVP
ncbi:MAG: DUF5060 domain-containing protein [Planctomycetota bacterium]